MALKLNYAFLHGGTQAGWVWADTIAALSRQNGGNLGRTLALDIPGCGAKRGRDTASLGIEDIAAELICDLLAAEMTDVMLVGHSQAGTLLPRLLEMRPDLFRCVVYVSCIAPLPGQSVRERPWAASSKVEATHLNTVDTPGLLRPMFCNDMNEAETSAFLAKLGKDAWPTQSMSASDWRYDHLGGVPSSYVICLKDAVLSVTWQETFAARLNVNRLARIDAGHQAMNTRPQALAEIIRRESALGLKAA